MSNKLIIFDCDGVLVDSEYIGSRIFSDALNSYGYPISLEETIRRFTGVNADKAREMILNEMSLDIPENYWHLEQAKLHLAYEQELIPLMLPLLEMLNNLKAARCVASNSAPESVINSLKISQQFRFFQENAIFTSSQVKFPKPSPDLFLFAAKEMGFSPKDCIVIEDSKIGAQAAISAGMELFFFLGGTHARYDWYKDSIIPFKRPIFSSIQELSKAICKALECV